MLRALAILLAGCGGEAYLQCPSPFALMQTEGACFDAAPALRAVQAAGIQIDPSSVRLTVLAVSSWEQPGAGSVEGWTDDLNVTIQRGGGSLAHELLHVSERPGRSNHEAWHANGFYALINLESYANTGTAAAWGYNLAPCAPPVMPAEMAAKLRAAGYPVDAFEQQAARVCE